MFEEYPAGLAARIVGFCRFVREKGFGAGVTETLDSLAAARTLPAATATLSDSHCAAGCAPAERSGTDLKSCSNNSGAAPVGMRHGGRRGAHMRSAAPGHGSAITEIPAGARRKRPGAYRAPAFTSGFARRISPKFRKKIRMRSRERRSAW